jgi:hypothetical protein
MLRNASSSAPQGGTAPFDGACVGAVVYWRFGLQRCVEFDIC